jgi:hypothetical protein
LVVTIALKSNAMTGAGAEESYWYSEVAFINKSAQSRLKPAHTLVVKMWEIFFPICRVP